VAEAPFYASVQTAATLHSVFSASLRNQ